MWEAYGEVPDVADHRSGHCVRSWVGVRYAAEGGQDASGTSSVVSMMFGAVGFGVALIAALKAVPQIGGAWCSCCACAVNTRDGSVGS
ncbi:hypothetical protein [Streptomyces sp. NPDC001820]|uniref:hypothetical protein n=1 Tax=Streptomyces sp. NPDC001820 TaxID=3364613 RepID=UPI0036C63B44